MKNNIEKKKNIISEIELITQDTVSTILIDYSKIKSLDINIIRKSLFDKNIIIKVLKNNLAKKAFINKNNTVLNNYLKGQILLIFINGNEIQLIKKIIKLKNEYDEFKIKFIYLYNKLFKTEDLNYLEMLPEKTLSISNFIKKIKLPLIILIKQLDILKNKKI